MRRPGPSSPKLRRRAASSVLLALLPLVIAIPALGATSSKTTKAAKVPFCPHFSRPAMASVIGTGPLRFKERTPHSNLCTWQAKVPGHYHELLSIDVVPAYKSVYSLAESDAIKTAAAQHQDFGTLSAHHNPWKAAFFVTGTTTDAGLEPCPPAHKLPKYGPPQCSADPDWTVINVNSYDSKLEVATGIVAQQGDVHLSHMIELNREILSGKIR